jgi:hypothetical protein
LRSSSAVRAAGILALTVASGAAALPIETHWLRAFRLLFGATAPAAYGALELAAALSALRFGLALAATLLSAAAEHLPASILDPERPDATAAEVWTQATRTRE